MTGFQTLPLRPELHLGIERLGFVAMTDIQEHALPDALSGRDLVGHACTGSGKTAAFGLALLQQLDVADRSVQALVLCPTRELAEQVTGDIRALAVGLAGTRALTLTGGAPVWPQRKAIEAGVHVIVGTPGRVLHHLQRKWLHLGTLRCLVLDEADRMLDMGFEDEVLGVVSHAPEARQTLLFSATWPAKITQLSARIQSDPRTVRSATLVDDQVLRQSAVLCEWDTRDAALCEVLDLREPTPTLVFCETRRDCQAVAGLLQDQGAAALELHGDLEQRDRDEVLVRMRNGSAQILVATNVAARGLDLAELRLVVCYQLSPDPLMHVHRVGRTARAEAAGAAVSIVAGPRELARLAAIEAHMGSEIPRTRSRATGPAPLTAWSAAFSTVVVLGGRNDKLRAGDILGALTRDVGVAGADVGKIVLTDHRAWVAVRKAVAKKAAPGLHRTKIKNKRFRVRLV